MNSTLRLSERSIRPLRLYVAGENAGTLRARSHCRTLQEAVPGLVFEEVDVLASPDLADAARILATPTLSDESQAPPRRIVGDLSDVDRILGFLGIERQRDINEAE